MWLSNEFNIFSEACNQNFALLLYNALSLSTLNLKITIIFQFHHHISSEAQKQTFYNHWDFPFSQQDIRNTKYFSLCITMQCDNYYYYHARQFHEVSFLVTNINHKTPPPLDSHSQTLIHSLSCDFTLEITKTLCTFGHMCQLKEMTYPIQIQYTDYTCIQPAVFPPYIRVIQKTLKKYIQGHRCILLITGLGQVEI